MVPGDTGDDAVKYIGFRLALSYQGASAKPNIVSSQDTMWSEVFAKPAPTSRPQTSSITSHPTAQDHLKASRVSNSFLYGRCFSSPLSDSAKLPANSVELEAVVNYLQQSTMTVDLFILSKYRAQCGRTITSLNEVLGQNRRHMILSEQDRLKLAAVISSNLLQLHGSPWMPKVIRSQDIYLIQSEDDPICDRFFVMQTLPNKTGPCIEENTELSSMRNQALFYLGVLLIELAFGKSLELLRSERDKSSTGLNSLATIGLRNDW
ncbi:hypothetical protein FBULB1_13593 [Fusarium bulbicola]|nr:hypothetical protein FBULB1_13593 [Fusarium bulbicola]